MSSLKDLQTQIDESASIMKNNLMPLYHDDHYRQFDVLIMTKDEYDKHDALFRKTRWQKIKGFFCSKN